MLPSRDRKNYINFTGPVANGTKGLIFAFISGVLFSACSLLVNRLSEYPPGEVTFLFVTSQCIFSIPFVIRDSRNITSICRKPAYIFGVLIFGMVLTASVVLWIKAISLLNIVQANIILISYPVFATIAAHFCLKEPFTIFHFCLVVLIVLGLTLVTRIPAMLSEVAIVQVNPIGIAIALSGMFLNIVLSLLFKILKDCDYTSICVGSGVSSILAILIYILAFENFVPFECGTGRYLALLFIFGNYAALITFSWSLRLEELGKSLVVRSAADVIFLFVFQTAVLHQNPDVLEIIGAFLVTLAVVFYGLQQQTLNIIASLLRKCGCRIEMS